MGELSNEPIPESCIPQMDGLQIGHHRLSTSCGVIERPDHHYSDDIVFIATVAHPSAVLCSIFFIVVFVDWLALLFF